MLKKGAMQPVKKVLGILLLAAGAGLIFMPDETAEILCNMKVVFGAVAGIAGYLLLISGRRM